MDSPTQTSISGLCHRAARRAPDSLDERLALVATCRGLGATVEPAMLGRFTVARSLGRGGQGCVYEGFDATLQRRVALKIPRFAHGTANDELTFEARALARVRHPNLVTVYALEHCEGRPVVVMELVEGTPLLAWVAERRPSLQRILEVIARIGDGLAELHRCGLTHRDVKPANVLMDGSGQPRLVDLGLAAHSGASAGAGGTPSFAAPEQRRRGTADPAADQFGLAATLLAATGGSRSALEAWPVPRRVRRAVLRALAEDPQARHADVAAFVRALGPGQRRRLAVLAGSCTIAASAMALLWPRAPTCPRDPAALQDALAQAGPGLRAHFEALGGTTARGPEALGPTLGGLESHAARWSDAVAGLCAATAAAPWDGARAQCLDDASVAFTNALADLVTLDAHTVAASALLVAALPAPETCVDAALEHLVPVIDHADTLAVRRSLSTTAQRCRYGLTPDCAAAYDAIAEDAARLGVEPCAWQPAVQLERTISAQYGGHPGRTQAALHEVVWAAQACGRDDVALDAQRILAEQIAAHDGDVDATLLALRSAEATLDRLGRPPSEEIAVLASRATCMLALGKPALAGAAAGAAIARHEALRGGSDEERAQLLGMQSAALHELGEDERALELQREALALRRATLGPHHPSVAHDLANLAVGLEHLDPGQARAVNREAIAIFEDFREGHELPLAMTLTHQAGFELDAGELDAAWSAIERALATFASIDAIDDAYAADARLVRARLWARSGELARARQDAAAGLAQLERLRGPEDVTTLAARRQVAALHPPDEGPRP